MKAARFGWKWSGCRTDSRLGWATAALVGVSLAALAGCKGPVGSQGASGNDGTPGTDGQPGAQGQPATSTGSLAVVVTDKLTGSPVAGVTIAVDPPVAVGSLSTDDQGAVTTTLPVGVFTLTFSRENFTQLVQYTSVVLNGKTDLQVALSPTSPVVVNAGADQTVVPGEQVGLNAKVEALDGSSIESYSWTQLSGVATPIEGSDSATPQLTLPALTTYKDALLASAPALDRYQVAAINPTMLDGARKASFQVTVTTSSGTWTDTVDLVAQLPWKVNPGLQNVPTQVPVLLQARVQDSWTWTLTVPDGSSARLEDAATRSPWFTPDVAGIYAAFETTSGTLMKVYAGPWVGAITGLGADGLPEAEECVSCHNGTMAPDKFTGWRTSGHASIFNKNLNESGHYGSACFTCHTVGYDTGAVNQGIDEAADFSSFLSSDLLTHPNESNAATLVSQYPATARKANVQCESCHGPNSTALHNNDTVGDPERVSIKAEVCATCHGDSPSYGRYQQWQTSLHADYDLPLEEATVESRGTTAGNCGRCHSGQGFIQWIKQGDLTQYIQGASGNATTDELTALGLTQDKVEPQTCATCHDPHQSGTGAYLPNAATTRLQDDVPMLPAGFEAPAVGRGAVCIACHNTRNGAHNDDVGAPTSYAGPHRPAQADVLMGENAYFVKVGARGSHSYLADTCATCHMEATAPPAEFSVDQAGTNHNFKASPEICANCHGDFNGSSMQALFQTELDTLAARMGTVAAAHLNDLGALKVRAYKENTSLYSSSSTSNANVILDTATNPVQVAELVPGRNPAFMLQLTTPVTITWTDGTSDTTDRFGVELTSLYGSDGIQVYVPASNMAKAFWNYNLITNDGSRGVHNPDFVSDVIDMGMMIDLNE